MWIEARNKVIKSVGKNKLYLAQKCDDNIHSNSSEIIEISKTFTSIYMCNSWLYCLLYFIKRLLVIKSLITDDET